MKSTDVYNTVHNSIAFKLLDSIQSCINNVRINECFNFSMDIWTCSAYYAHKHTAFMIYSTNVAVFCPVNTYTSYSSTDKLHQLAFSRSCNVSRSTVKLCTSANASSLSFSTRRSTAWAANDDFVGFGDWTTSRRNLISSSFVLQHLQQSAQQQNDIRLIHRKTYNECREQHVTKTRFHGTSLIISCCKISHNRASSLILFSFHLTIYLPT